MGLLVRVVAAVAIAAAVGAATASATAADRGWAPGGTLTSVDTTEGAAAAGLAWTPKGCEGVVLWVPWRKAQYTFRLPKPCPATSTGRAVSAVGVSGTRVVFLSYAGGNTREWRLWTATPSAGWKLLRFVAADADAAAPILVGNGGAEGIPYAVGRELTVMRPNGARAGRWTLPADPVALAEASGAVAVVLANGHVLVASLGGTVLHDYAFPPGAATAARPVLGGAVVETTGGIELHEGAGPAERFPVAAHAHLAGYVDGTLAYTTASAIRTYVRSTGKDTVARVVSPPVHADFDRLGLAWTQGRRLCWSVRVGVVHTGTPTRGCR